MDSKAFFDQAKQPAAWALPEQKVTAAQEEVLAKQETDLTTALIQADRLGLLNRMASHVSHDVRNPLTTVRGFLQLMEQRDTTERKAHYRLMIAELDRATTILSDYLSLVRQTAIQKELHDLNSLIHSLQPLVSPDLTVSKTQLSFALSPLPSLHLDPVQMRQMLLHLLQNALEASAEGDVITVRTELSEDCVTVLVEDCGTGIPAHVMANIGSPFNTTKPNRSGLGLAVCYAVARLHEATIDLKTGPGGTCVCVRLPVIAKHSEVNPQSGLPSGDLETTDTAHP